METCSKIRLAADVWTDGKTTRLLAEHYQGLLTLSRLELISLGLEALSNRQLSAAEEFSQGDVAYALMSLLRYRPRMDPEANLFQALARLSLANDSDRIVERMVCLLPDPHATYRSAFVVDDALGAKLWDVEPLCQVAGVGESDEVFLDGCQAANIRWKDVPRINFYGRNTWKKRLTNLGWRTTPIWILIGIGLLATGSQRGPHSSDSNNTTGSDFTNSQGYYNGSATLTYQTTPMKYNNPTALGFGIVIFLFGFALLLYAPWAIQRMHSGKVWGSTPWLIGFEGILPLKQVERLFFGNCNGRLSYAPSSGLYSCRNERERIGSPPPWTEHASLRDAPPLPVGHRWFTLVDTGPSMQVHIFSAKMPPSVALICGKEGGMLRVVLCSYEAQGNLLRKESVLRMETPMLSLTKMHTWLRLSLGLGA